jgi:hypothetical protein
MWWNNTEHDRHDCPDHREALHKDLIYYYEGNRIHSMETRQPLKMNFTKGGMKKLLDEASGPTYYSASAGIHIGGSHTSHIEF